MRLSHIRRIILRYRLFTVYEDTVIISVLNGISSEKIIASEYGSERIIHCVAQGMDAVKLGDELTYSKMGELIVGTPEAEKEKLEC